MGGLHLDQERVAKTLHGGLSEVPVGQQPGLDGVAVDHTVSIPLRTLIRPLHPSGTSVVSRPARCGSSIETSLR
jgi:hypothetical protein